MHAPSHVETFVDHHLVLLFDRLPIWRKLEKFFRLHTSSTAHIRVNRQNIQKLVRKLICSTSEKLFDFDNFEIFQ